MATEVADDEIGGTDSSNYEDDAFSSFLNGDSSEQDSESQDTLDYSAIGQPQSTSLTSAQNGQPEQPQASTNVAPEHKDYISLADAGAAIRQAIDQDIPAPEFYALLEDLYSKSETTNPEVSKFYAEVGQMFKESHGIEYSPDFSQIVPPMQYSGFDSTDKKKESIDAWKERAKSQLHLVMGADYGLNKLGIDAKIDAMAKQRKRNIDAIAEYGEAKQGEGSGVEGAVLPGGEPAPSGKTSDVFARLGQGFVADTLKSFGATDLAESAEDFFVENPRFDADTTSEVAAFIGMGGGNIATGMAVAAMTGALGNVLGLASKATALAETGVTLSKASTIGKILKTPFINPGVVGSAVSAGAGASLVGQDVYERIYQETGSTEAATRGWLMAQPGVIAGTFAHYFIAAGIMNPLSKALMTNKAAIVNQVAKAIETQTDIKGLNALKTTLSKAYALGDSRTKAALLKAAESGITGAAGLSVMNASMEDAISANIPTMEDTGFDITNQGKSAALGLLAGAITGGVGGIIESPNAANAEKLRKVYARIQEKEAQIHQALFDELASKSPDKQAAATSELAGGEPAEEPPAAPGAAAEAAQTPEQQVLTVKEEAIRKIDDITRKESNLAGLQEGFETELKKLPTFDASGGGEKINLREKIKQLQLQREALLNEREQHQRTIEIADLQDRIVSEQKRANDLVSKVPEEKFAERQEIVSKSKETIKGIQEQLQKLGAAEKPILNTFKTKRGSEYSVAQDGSTIRTKAARAEGDPNFGIDKQEGPQKPSAKTIYVSPEAAKEIGMWQTSSAEGKGIGVKDGKLVLTSEGKDGKRGIDKAVSDLSFKTIPEVGLHPIELFSPDKEVSDFYRDVHPGSEIVSISKSEKKVKQPEQPKTNEQLLRNRLTRQGVNPEIPVEKLTQKQRINEIGALNSEFAGLPEDLQNRLDALVEHHKQLVKTDKEAKLTSKLHLDTDPIDLKANQLRAERNALENYDGELTGDHAQRLNDVLAAMALHEEADINKKAFIDQPEKKIESFTPKEVEHAITALEDHQAKLRASGKTLPDAQFTRLNELRDRAPKLFETLTDEAYNSLPKHTKELAHDSPTLGELIRKQRELKKPENRAAIQEAIDKFKDSKNIQKEETPIIEKTISAETIQKAQQEVSKRRGARAAHAEREARQAQLEAAHANAEKVPKKPTRDTGDVRSRLTSFGQTAEAVSEPMQTAKPKVSDTAKTKGGFQSPNEPPKSYAEIRKQQDEVVAKNNTTHKEPYSVPGSDKVELDLTKVANSRREELQKKFPRIAPEKRDPINPPKKMNDILRKVNDYFKVRFRYQGLSKNGSLLGVYTGRIGNAITSAANKASTAVHELGHRLDHMFGIGEDWIKTAGEHKFDSELEKFWVHGSPYKDIIGKRVEGIAEYLHAYMFNEAEARRAAPEFTKFFESKIPAEDLAHIREVGRDFVDRYNSSALELTNLQHQTTEEALNTKSSWLSRLFGDTRTTGSAVPWTTVLFSKFNRDAGNDWIFDHIINELGIDKQDILPQNDPRVWMRGVRKVSGIIQDMFDNGIADLIDPQFNAETGFKRLTKTGYAEIFDPLVGSSNPEFDIHETSSLLLSERTKAILEPVEAKRNELIERASSMEDLVTTENGVEIPNPEKEALNAQIYELNRQLNETTGTSSGFEGRNDLDIARETIAKLEADPERLAKLKQVGENVREWFDGLLTVAEKTGLISSKSAKNMRAKGEFYAPMYRLLEQGVDSFVDSSIDPLSRRHGSTKTIKNLQASLLEASYKLTERAYKNYGKLQMMDFFNPIKVEVSAIKKRLLEEDPSLAKDQARLQELAFDEVNRTKANENVFGGKSTDISNIAYKLEFNGESVEPKGEAERALTTRLIRNGRVEYWKWSDQFLKEQFDKSIDLHNTNIPILAPINNFFKFMVTHASPFAIRNPIRDTFARLFESEAGAKRGLKSTFSGFATDKDIALLRQSMGDQSGYHLRNYADFARFQRQAMYDKGLVKGNIFIPVQKGFKKWGDLVASGERFNRIREYKASFDFAKDQGFSDYDAHLYAGNQASGIMDFTSAGEWMRGLENFFPFASAGSVGVRKMVSTLKAHPGRSMAYFVAMGIIPSLIERTMAKVGGYEKEWDERSPIYKDMFMSFKVADNMWIHVPRFYELAVMSNMANRLLDKWEGKPGSFEGAAANMARSFIPIDPLDIGSPLGAPFEALGNYDTFRQRPIVPVDSETARLSERKEPKTASTISLAIHNALIDWGVDDSFFAKKFGDARKLDYLFLALTGTLGSEALTIQDLAKADKRARYIKKLGGIFGETPATNSRDALFVNDFIASENISPQSKQLQKYALLRDSYYDAETESEKEQAAQKFLAEAERLRHIMETIGPDYFRSAKSIENRRMKKLAAEREKNK